MEKNRLFIIISAAVAILGYFLAMGNPDSGTISSYFWKVFTESGWIVIVLASCLRSFLLA